MFVGFRSAGTVTRFITVIAALSALEAAPLQQRPSPEIRVFDAIPAQSSQWKIGTVEEARLKALESIGMAPGREKSGPVTLIEIVDPDRSIMNRLLSRRPLWKVQANGWSVPILPASPPSTKDQYERIVDTLIDPTTGVVCSVVTRWPAGVPPIPLEPDADSYEEQMLGSANERYHGIPDRPPSITFTEAVRAIEEGGGNSLVAKQITGYWVLWSEMGREPKPMWVITLRGVPPIEAAYDGVPEHYRDHLRYVVDPETRRWVIAKTVPQPRLDGNDLGAVKQPEPNIQGP